MDPVERFSRSGAKNLKSMSPKVHPVKTFSEKDGPQPGFKTGIRGQRQEFEKVRRLEDEKVRKKLTF